MRWPSGLDASGFLARHWQKAPLYLPAALPGFEDVVAGDDLAALSCEPEVESRLVRGEPGGDWTLEHGPFDEADFAALPARGWTLLVQDVDKHLPAVAAVLSHFDFVPAWRLDDVMISYAAPGGSVGPHVDAYDVFLLQAAGRRTWALDPAPSDLTQVAGVPLRLLARFRPVERLELAPGDLLYLPPGVAHHGAGGEASITWSIGFRAPSAADLLRELAAELDEQNPVPRYEDPDLTAEEARPGWISPAAVSRARRLLEPSAGALNDDRAAVALGRALTRPKAWLAPDPAPAPIGAAALGARLRAGGVLRRRARSRIAWCATADAVWLFADGERWRLSPALAGFAARCAQARAIRATDLAGLAETTAALEILAALAAQGSLGLDSEDGGEAPA